MLVIIISILAVVAIFVVAGLKIDKYGLSYKRNRKQRLCVLGLLPLLFGCFSIVPANSVGIMYSPFNGVRSETLLEGIHYKNPLDKLYILSTEVQTQVVSNLSGQTKDAQYLSMTIDVKYRVDTRNAFEIFKQFRTLANLNSSLIAPTLQRSIESVTTQYNVIDILGEYRNEVYAEIEADLMNRLEVNGVSFYSVTFIDTDAGEAIENAIQAEAVAKKAVETAEQEKARVKTESEQKAIQAQAAQDAARIQAETSIIEATAEAEAAKATRVIQAKAEQEASQIQIETTVALAKAQAQANQMISASITGSLIEMKEAEARLQHGWVTVQGASALVDVR